jgi:hypothetical protein
MEEEGSGGLLLERDCDGGCEDVRGACTSASAFVEGPVYLTFYPYVIRFRAIQDQETVCAERQQEIKNLVNRDNS